MDRCRNATSHHFAVIYLVVQANPMTDEIFYAFSVRVSSLTTIQQGIHSVCINLDAAPFEGQTIGAPVIPSVFFNPFRYWVGRLSAKPGSMVQRMMVDALLL